MAYKLESIEEQQEVLRDTLFEWSKNDHDVHIVSDEGHKIYTRKILLCFYSPLLRSIFESLPEASSSTPVISIPASSKSISCLLKLITTGKTSSNNKETLVQSKEAAKALGISLNNCLFEALKSPTLSGSTLIRKLPATTEALPSAKATSAKIAPANLSTFRDRKPGLDGIKSKWNTVIIPKDGTKGTVSKISSVVTATPTIAAPLEDSPKSLGDLLPCDHCPKKFRGRRNLKRHGIRRHGISSKKGNKFGNVTIKLENQDLTVTEVHCTECDQTFKSEKRLKKHTLTHTSKHSCDDCGKTFQSSSSLRLHSNIHLEAPAFSCEICNKGFSQAGNLKTHKLRYHSDDTSNQAPADTSDASLPELTSTTENTTEQNICGYCEEKFDDTAELNSHMVLLHNVQETNQ